MPAPATAARKRWVLGNGEHVMNRRSSSGDAHAVGVDGILGQNRVDPGRMSAEVAVAEVLAIGRVKASPGRSCRAGWA